MYYVVLVLIYFVLGFGISKLAEWSYHHHIDTLKEKFKDSDFDAEKMYMDLRNRKTSLYSDRFSPKDQSKILRCFGMVFLLGLFIWICWPIVFAITIIWNHIAFKKTLHAGAQA